jgi:hypothetical protein
MSDDRKLTRRYFLQQSAYTTALAGGLYCISQKTDALGQQQAFGIKGPNEDGDPYPYHNPP